MDQRHFQVKDFLKPAAGEPLRSVITRTEDAAVVAWCVLPGQVLSAHVHPEGQDTWTVLSGTGLYRLDSAGATVTIRQGDVVVARRGDVHGVHNDGAEPLVMVAVVSPAESGFELLDAEAGR